MKFTIEQARILAGFTQAEMAKKLGMTEKTYIQYEKYRRVFRMDVAYRFAEVTGFNVDQIIFLKENYRKSVVNS